jgi:DNA polymerase alpha subunit A
MDRERRHTKKVDKFAALRAAREGGSRSEQWKVEHGRQSYESNVLTGSLQESAEDLYDTVSTETYNKIVKGRLQKDDFIVDDDGGGYQDNGMDDWEAGEDTRMKSSGESDNDAQKGNSPRIIYDLSSLALFLARRKAKATERDVQKRKGQKSAKAPAPVPPAALNAYRPAPAPHKEEDFMNSLLSSMDASAPRMASSSSRKRKPSPARDSSRKIDMRKTLRPRIDEAACSSESEHVPDTLPTFKRQSSPASEMDTMPLRSTKRPKGSYEDPVGVTNGMNNLGFKSEAAEPDEFDLMDLDNAGFETVAIDDFGLTKDTGDVFDDEKDVKGKNGTAPRTAKFAIEKKDEDAPPSWLSIAASLAKVEGPSDSTDTLLSAPIDPSNASKVNALEDDGSLRMFWLDYLELAGKVYFIGKVLDRAAGNGSKPRWVSCCATVDNLERNLFVLPRGHRVSGSYV